MENINISELQKLIKQIDHKNNSVDKYFYKLSEEIEELAKAIRKNERMDENKIKNKVVLIIGQVLAVDGGFTLNKRRIIYE